VGDRSKDGTGVLLSGSAVIFSPGVKVDGFAAVARTSVLLGGTFVVELEVLEDATNTINRPNNISKNNNIDKFPDYNVFYINNIYEYCDALNSCKNFLTLTSGAHVMASAIKNNNSRPNITCWIPWNKKSDEEEKGYYCFPNVKYYDINDVDVL
jgi:hypothetical protein